MSTPTYVVRAKPAWLTLYGYYLWAAVFLCVAAIVRAAGETGPISAVMLLPQVGLFGFAVYSLWHWKVGWTRKFHLWLNAGVVILGIIAFAPLAGYVPYILYYVIGVISVPVYVLIPNELLQSQTVNIAVGLAVMALAAYWSVCWMKFNPVPEGNAADLASEKLSRDVRSNVRKVIIGLFLVGVAAVVKALFDGANGNSVWAVIGGFCLLLAVAALILIQTFPGSSSLSAEEMETLAAADDREAGWADGTRDHGLYGEPNARELASEIDPLADDDLNPDEVRHLKALRRKSKEQKDNILNKDVTGCVIVLFGIPALLVIGYAAFMITIVDGGGVGTFLGIFVLLVIVGAVKLIKW